MYGIFVNEDTVWYAEAIVNGEKPVETRNRNMLAKCVGSRVAIVRTKRGQTPMIIGYAIMHHAEKHDRAWFDKHRDLTLIPEGSAFDCKPDGYKWCYHLSHAFPCEPFPLPDNTIRHGRSYCEF